MTPVRLKLTACFTAITSLVAQAAITPEQAKTLPLPADHAINFSKEIKPILEASCIKCHGRGRDKGDFQIDSRETLLKAAAPVQPSWSAKAPRVI
jgi:cytochrome c553